MRSSTPWLHPFTLSYLHAPIHTLCSLAAAVPAAAALAAPATTATTAAPAATAAVAAANPTAAPSAPTAPADAVPTPLPPRPLPHPSTLSPLRTLLQPRLSLPPPPPLPPATPHPPPPRTLTYAPHTQLRASVPEQCGVPRASPGHPRAPRHTFLRVYVAHPLAAACSLCWSGCSQDTGATWQFDGLAEARGQCLPHRKVRAMLYR